MSRLIVNADDFGLTSGINRAIVQLHQGGVLTSTTLMANAAASHEAAEMARKNPSLGVGCHVVLVDGVPVVDPRELPTLVNRKTGRFHATPGEFLSRLFTGRIRSREIEAEAAAQIGTLRSYGLSPSHIDTHKHMHMFPTVLRSVLRAARAAGIRRVRNPFEPVWSLNATAHAPEMRRLEVILLRRFEPAFLSIVASEGFTTTEGTIGVLATGTLDIATVVSLLSAMPEGTFELATHPGYKDEDLEKTNTRLLGSREIERNALLAISRFEGIDLISFAKLNNSLNAELST